MCGIVGAVGRTPQETGWMPAACAALTHRGPDASGEWHSPDRRVAFGFRRLAIIDLSEAGSQPMADSSGSLRVVMNGEIYNYKELREELRRLGHAFRSASDTEVLLAAYRQWGADCLRRLNGMFAFALYDEGAQRVLIARDRAGEKPLFFVRAPGRLSFASELKALFVDPSVDRTLDVEAMDHYIAYGYVPGRACLVRGINKLPPAHALSYDLNTEELQEWRYWDLPAETSSETATDDELVSRLKVLLGDSVRRQLVADVPVGVLLSGGVDSSLITALAASGTSQRVRTFSVVFPGHGAYDEARYARSVAEHFGTEHHELIAEPASVDLLPRLVRQFDEPIGDSSMIPTFLVSQLVRSSCTVALGGDGGDELFGGYTHYQRYLRYLKYRRVVPGPVKRVIGGMALGLPVGLRGRNYLTSLRRRDADGWVDATLHFDRGTRRALSPLTRSQSGEPPEEYRLASATGGSALQRMTSADFATYLPEDILVKVDRASMLTSLEVRAPFLDYRVIDFAFGEVPPRLRATAGARKILLRMLGKQILPRSMDLARKQGFSIPLASWFDDGWGKVLGNALKSAPPSLFDQKKIAELLGAHEKGYPVAQRIFNLAMLELWRREHRIQLPA